MDHLMPDHYFTDLSKVPDTLFSDNNLKYALCDIDNTLITYSQNEPDDYAMRFLERMKRIKVSVILISNNTNAKRSKKFADLSSLPLIPNARKPYKCKDSIINMLRSLGLENESGIFIGDQIFTDVLAGKRCGIKTLLVEPLGKTHIPFFFIRRMMEKPVKKKFIALHGINY